MKKTVLINAEKTKCLMYLRKKYDFLEEMIGALFLYRETNMRYRTVF
jgi:hypothetical protein